MVDFEQMVRERLKDIRLSPGREAEIVDEVAQSYNGRVKIGKVNIEQDQALAAQYGVHSIPTLLFFHQGQVTEQIVALRSKRELKASFDRVAA